MRRTAGRAAVGVVAGIATARMRQRTVFAIAASHTLGMAVTITSGNQRAEGLYSLRPKDRSGTSQHSTHLQRQIHG
jgi:hypothetical protein